jgi:hypothetical protein
MRIRLVVFPSLVFFLLLKAIIIHLSELGAGSSVHNYTRIARCGFDHFCIASLHDLLANVEGISFCCLGGVSLSGRLSMDLKVKFSTFFA